MGTVQSQVPPSSPKNPPVVNHHHPPRDGPGEHVVTSTSAHNANAPPLDVRARRRSREEIEAAIVATLARSKGPLTLGELFARGTIRGGRGERRRAVGRLVRRGLVQI